MNTLFDKYGNLNIDDIIAEQLSFQSIMADGIITEQEIKEQADRVSLLLHKFEKDANQDQIECMREILAELCVLVAINNKK